MDRHVVVVSLVGGARLDLSQAELAAKEVTLTKVSLVGGHPAPGAAGRSGSTCPASAWSAAPAFDAGPKPGPGAPTVHIRAFSLVGGTRIYRGGPAGQSQPVVVGAGRAVTDGLAVPAAGRAV